MALQSILLYGAFVPNDAGETSQREANFSVQSVAGAKTSYIEPSTNLGLSSTMEISHDLKQIGAPGNDRHAVSFKRVYLDSKGQSQIASVTLTLSAPRAGVADAGTIAAFPPSDPSFSFTYNARDARDQVITDLFLLLRGYIEVAGGSTTATGSPFPGKTALVLADGITP